MKKMYTFIALLIAGNHAFAQNLSRTDIGYEVGDTYSMYSSDYVDPGTAGTGVTWDLSSMTNNQEVTVAVTANSGGTFPSANVKVTQSNGGILYYNITNSIQEVVGIDAGGTVMTFSNPITYAEFPMTSSYNYTDQMNGTFTVSSYQFTRTGTTQSEFSGYGTLITPEGTYTNVVRVKTTQNITDTYSLGSITSTIVSYVWFKAGVNYELASIGTTSSNGSDTQQAYYTSIPDNLGVNENEIANLSIFPNPATDNVTVQSDEMISRIEVYTLAGELVQTQENLVSNHETVAVSALNTGMYLIKVTATSGAVSTQRVAVK